MLKDLNLLQIMYKDLVLNDFGTINCLVKLGPLKKKRHNLITVRFILDFSTSPDLLERTYPFRFGVIAQTNSFSLF